MILKGVASEHYEGHPSVFRLNYRLSSSNMKIKPTMWTDLRTYVHKLLFQSDLVFGKID